MPFKKQRMGGRKVCYFTKNNIKYIDYKDVELLKDSSAPCYGYELQVSAQAGGRNQACPSDGSSSLRC